MPTDTARSQAEALYYGVRFLAWSLGIFGLLRLGWVELHAVLPMTRLQAAAALQIFGPSTLPIEVTLACSGADATALCSGAIAAYPVGWRTRLAGLLCGLAVVVSLNVARIGTLGVAAASPAWFAALHLYLWPALLTLGIAAYVFAWMRAADQLQPHAADRVVDAAAIAGPKPTRRFVALTASFVLLFSVASPFYLHSTSVLAVASLIARATAAILNVTGVSAQAAANVLWTANGGFMVTQECIATPLLPVYLAAVCATSTTRRRIILGIAAAVPLFVALGIVRLLIVALPSSVAASPLFLVHAFYQLLLGAVLVVLAARWRHGGDAALGHASLGLLAGFAFAYLLGPLYTRLVAHGQILPLDDPQGAIALLPTFQTSLYLALWIAAFIGTGWRRFVAGLAVLGLSQAVGLFAMGAVAGHLGRLATVPNVRAWAVVGPLLIMTLVRHWTGIRSADRP